MLQVQEVDIRFSRACQTHGATCGCQAHGSSITCSQSSTTSIGNMWKRSWSARLPCSPSYLFYMLVRLPCVMPPNSPDQAGLSFCNGPLFLRFVWDWVPLQFAMEKIRRGVHFSSATGQLKPENLQESTIKRTSIAYIAELCSRTGRAICSAHCPSHIEPCWIGVGHTGVQRSGFVCV